MKYEAEFVAAGSVPLATSVAASTWRREIRLCIYAALALGDGVAISIAFLLATLIRFGTPFDPAGLTSLTVMLPVYYGIAFQRKPYSGRFFTNWRRTAHDAITALVTAIAVSAIVAFSIHAQIDISRSVVPIGGIFSGLALIGTRALIHRIALPLLGGHPIATIVLIDGAPIDVPPGVRSLDTGVYGLRPDPTDPHALDRLSAAIGRAERVVLACPGERREAWAVTLKGANVQGEIVTPDLMAIGAVRLSSFADCASVVVSLGPLDTLNRILKRTFDIGVSLATLALLWPLLLGVAIAIRLDSPGPISFRQPRMGRGNALFSILKFRSMRIDACDIAGDRSTERDDPRITRVGRFIRATSIDELPQILNVLRGTMSIVGPRPHALGSLAGDKLFWEVDRHYWYRHAVKPGITGLAQINGFRGATTVPEDLENRLRSDISYMRGWTIWRDIRILAATTGVLLHRNAF
ncbi:sugar transferase [Sphingomonas sp. UYP23]